MAKNNSDPQPAEIQVKALFLDYDGTIAPLDVPRSQSAVSPQMLMVLNQIGARIPIAMISTKDLTFLVGRTPFARGWSGMGGLETKVGNVTTTNHCLHEKTRILAKALKYAKRFATGASEIIIEEKHDSNGRVAAFSVDWRQAKNRNKAERQVPKIRVYCEKLPLATIRYAHQPFFDVFPCPVEKGKAVKEMKQKLGVTDGVLFMGDSAVDNAAFQAADVAVGVTHGGATDDLLSSYFVEFEEVQGFLETLLKSGFRFKADMLKTTTKARRAS